MRKRILSVLALCLIFSMVLDSVNVYASASSNMEKVLTQYQKKNYKTAEKYNKKLSKYATETCVKKMTSNMKKAYKKVISTYSFKRNKKGRYLWEIFYSDIDNDNKAELLIKYGSCEGDVYLRVYKYSKGKAVYVAHTDAGHSTFYAYPGHKGIVRMCANMGYETIAILTLNKTKIKTKSLGYRDVGKNSYFPLRQQLKSYVKYNSKGKPYKIDYSVLK